MIRRIAALGGSAVLLAGGLAAAGHMGGDPSEQVAPVSVPQVSLAPSTPPDGSGSPGGSSGARTPASGSGQVEALDRLDGELKGEDDPGEYRLGTVDLDFGPDAWVLTAPPAHDYDGNGRIERLEVELDALVGRQVRLLVRLDDGNEASVYVINDLPYRDPAGPGPWVIPATATPTVAPAAVADVRTAAADAVGPGSRVDELEPLQAGQVAWEASVTRSDGIDFVVLLDAAGTVLTVRED